MSDFENTIDGLAVVGLGVYLAMVVIRGNAKAFLTQASGEIGFLEFIVAIYLLSLILGIPQLQPFRGPIVFAVVFIIAAKIVSQTNSSNVQAFANGNISLFQFAQSLFSNVTTNL